MQKEGWLALFGITIGVSFTVAAMALPLAYPQASFWVWRALFWGGLGIGAVSFLFLICGLFFRHRSKTQQQITELQPINVQPVLDQLQDEDFMPLSEAVEKLREEGKKQTTFGIGSMDSHLAIQNPDKEFDRLARYFNEYVDIYGKTASSTFNNWGKVNEDYFSIGDFKRRASELHLRNHFNRGPEFTDLAIKKDCLEKAIKEILSSYTIYQG